MPFSYDTLVSVLWERYNARGKGVDIHRFMMDPEVNDKHTSAPNWSHGILICYNLHQSDAICEGDAFLELRGGKYTLGGVSQSGMQDCVVWMGI